MRSLVNPVYHTEPYSDSIGLLWRDLPAHHLESILRQESQKEQGPSSDNFRLHWITLPPDMLIP